MRKTPIRVETQTRMVTTRKKEIGSKVMVQERRKIMEGDRMAATKETRTEINLIRKIPFPSLVSMVVPCKASARIVEI